MNDEYELLPTNGRIRQIDSIVVISWDEGLLYHGEYPEYVYTDGVDIFRMNSMFTDLTSSPNVTEVVEKRGDIEMTMKNLDDEPYLFVDWVRNEHEPSRRVIPVTGGQHKMERLRRAVEEVNALPEDMSGAILSTGDLFLGYTMYITGGNHDCSLKKLLNNVQADDLDSDLSNLVYGHIWYLDGSSSHSPILEIKEHARLEGRNNCIAYDLLEKMEAVAERSLNHSAAMTGDINNGFNFEPNP